MELMCWFCGEKYWGLWHLTRSTMLLTQSLFPSMQVIGQVPTKTNSWKSLQPKLESL